VLIRPAVASDADRVFTMLGQLELSTIAQRSAFDETFAELVDDASAALVLTAVDDDGTVVGYALTTINPLLYITGRSAQLHELVVDDHHRGQGVGTALIERLEQVCRDEGVLQLTVASRRSAAFYERIGYRSTADFLKRTFD